MELRQIRYFLAVADAGSFVAGARRAYVTQPTLSAAISALERELGGALFERRARGVVLTALGERALEHARAALRESEILKGLRRETSGAKPLRAGVLPTLAPGFVAEALERLGRLLGERGWRAEDAPMDVLRRRLAAGRYDVILTSLRGLEPGHRQLELARDAQALAFQRGHRMAGPIGPEILAGQPLVVRTHCEQLHAASRILDERGVKPRVIARTDNDARALALVASGLGACLMPDSFAHDGVVFIRPDGVNLPRRLGLEWIRGAAQGWVDMAAERLSALDGARSLAPSLTRERGRRRRSGP